jgi:hypothetical protein
VEYFVGALDFDSDFAIFELFDDNAFNGTDPESTDRNLDAFADVMSLFHRPSFPL